MAVCSGVCGRSGGINVAALTLNPERGLPVRRSGKPRSRRQSSPSLTFVLRSELPVSAGVCGRSGGINPALLIQDPEPGLPVRNSRKFMETIYLVAALILGVIEAE